MRRRRGAPAPNGGDGTLLPTAAGTLSFLGEAAPPTPMSSNDGEQYQRAAALFARACELPEERRAAFLRSEAGGDASMFRLASALLANDSSPGDPLTRAASHAVDLLGDFDADLADDSFTPERIGAFRCLRRIGEGGMGIVFEAEQENPHRIVALKVVRPGMATATHLRRFELEAEALARLEHPAIARIYEAGTADTPWGRVPYFAMERVQGRPLATHCAEAGLSLRERVALLASVCEAIEYAHGKGVVHRDLKSSNVLVGEDGIPKVLDFGVARLVEAGETRRTELTLEGQVIGTLATMSPEQVRGDVRRIDARTDVYALGSMAYELLAGRPPLCLEGKPLAEAARIVEETDPPRLATLVPSCRGDLDVIVGKALEKDPERRYASASALAADLTRFLRDEPILARPPSAATLLRKFTRRNRTSVAAGVVGACALTAGASVAIWKAVEATGEREVAASRTAEAERSGRDARSQAYRANLSAALAALQLHDVVEATRRLEEAPPELRGWEWHHLWSRLDESIANFAIGAGGVTALDLAPDGRSFAAALSTGRLELWSLETGERLASLERPGHRSDALRFSRDGRTLLSATVRGGALCAAYDLPQLSERQLWSAKGPGAREAAFDNGGGQLLRPVSPQVFAVLDASTGDTLAQFPLDAESAVFAASPDDSRVAIGDLRGFGVRRLQDGLPLVRRDDIGGVQAIAFRGDGARLIVGMYGPEAHVCDAATGASLLVLAGHGAGVTCAQFSPDERRIATASGDGTVRLWDANLGIPRKTWHGHRGRVRRLLFTPDGERLVTAGDDGCVRVWSAKEGDDPLILVHPQTVYGLAFSPDGARLATGCLETESPSLFVWDALSGTRVAAWLNAQVTVLAWSDDGSRLAVGRHNRPISVLDAASGVRVAVARLHNYNTDSVAFDASTGQIVSSGLDGRLHFDDASTGKAIRAETLGSARGEATPLYRAVVGGGGAWIAASRLDRSIAIFEGPERAERRRLTGHDGFVVSLAASPDGNRLASGSLDGEIRIWSVADGALVATLRSHSQEVFALAFSPDGARLVSGGRDRAIRVWSTDRWEEVVRLGGHTSFIYALTFSPDGQTLASAGGDDTVRLWGVLPRAERNRHRLERARIAAEVAPQVEAAFLAEPEPTKAVARLRQKSELEGRALEVALQEALRRGVSSRPSGR